MSTETIFEENERLKKNVKALQKVIDRVCNTCVEYSKAHIKYKKQNQMDDFFKRYVKENYENVYWETVINTEMNSFLGETKNG